MCVCTLTVCYMMGNVATWFRNGSECGREEGWTGGIIIASAVACVCGIR